MILTSLSLQNFRNYRQHSFNFSPSTTVIVGPNASGKTNILEAIYLLGSGKSFRATKDREMISYGKKLSVVSCQLSTARGQSSVVSGRLSDSNTSSQQSSVLTDRNEQIKLEVMLTIGKVQGQKAPYKKLSVDGAGKRLTDFVGYLSCVIFWPEDLELITGSPSRRRKYLDGVLFQVDKKYRRHLTAYQKALRSRNKLLEKVREGKAGQKQLKFWNNLVIESGKYLTKQRKNFIDFINTVKVADLPLQPVLKGFYKRPAFAIGYESSIISQDRLAKYAGAEIAAGMTLIGPHRDDFLVKMVNQVERNLHTYGSRGEQRLAVLWLKLAELAFVEKVTGDRPILLLDDILSELDQQYRRLVFELIGKQQTIITTTDEHLLEDVVGKYEVLKLI